MGDAAGIRASIRGIDLILEQGMNVKVVTFPDGEDPDSFAKKHTEVALREYLEESSQDFINFKVSLLMKEASNDPVKKAGLIRDIVASISKIPDSIQREVYVQECSRIMEISERVLFSELAQLISKNSKDFNKTQQKEKQSLEVVKKQTEQLKEVDSLFILEREIIRILLLFGNQETDFVDFIEVEDEEGVMHLEKEKYTNQVSKELYLNLQDDEIEFSNEIFQSIYYEMIHQLNQEDKIEMEAFINHPNTNISSIVTSILMDDEKYTLSDWERKNIFVTESEEVLSKLVTDAILNLRRILIDKKIQQLINPKEGASVENTDLEMIQNYTELKKRLYSKLMRVV